MTYNHEKIKKLYLLCWGEQTWTYKLSFFLFFLSTTTNLYISFINNDFLRFATYNTIFVSIIALFGWAREPLSKSYLIKMISFLLLFLCLIGYFFGSIEGYVSFDVKAKMYFLEFIFLTTTFYLNNDKFLNVNTKMALTKVRVTLNKTEKIYKYKILKHLKMIDKKIDSYGMVRMKIKKFCLALASICSLFDVHNPNISQYSIAFICIFIPYLCDAHYLYLIKSYEQLYEDVTKGLYNTYSIKIETHIMESIKYLFDISLLSYYGVLATVFMYNSIKIDISIFLK